MFPPWQERGRFSVFKTVIFFLLFVPGAWIAYLLATNQFGPRPLNAAIHEIGLWAIRLIFLSLAITPLRQVLHWPRLHVLRRMVGVAALIYTVVHFLFYIADQAFDLAKVVSEIVLRIYLTIGFVALLGLMALGVTSTDAMTRRMGRRWQQLHYLAYPIAILAVIHHFIQSKVNVSEPLLMTGLLVWLLGYRLIARLTRTRGALPVGWLVLLAVAGTAAAAGGEAIYFWMKLGIDPMRVLWAQLDDLRASSGVFIASIVVAAGAAIRAWQARGHATRLRPA